MPLALISDGRPVERVKPERNDSFAPQQLPGGRIGAHSVLHPAVPDTPGPQPPNLLRPGLHIMEIITGQNAPEPPILAPMFESARERPIRDAPSRLGCDTLFG